MKNLCFLLSFLLVPCGLLAQVDIASPGSGGMISNRDIAPGEVRYMKNLDSWNNPGKMQLRQGLEAYGATQSGVTGFFSIYEPLTGHKVLTGIADSAYLYYDAGLPVIAGVGQIVVSDTFATDVANGAEGFAFPNRGGYHDWTICEWGVILCGGDNLPLLVTLYEGVEHTDSTQDTLAYNPRTIPIGLPAPGQLVVGNSGAGGPLKGIYQYAYAFLDTLTDSTSALSIASAPVTLNEQSAYLTQFDMYAHDNKKPLVICRKQIGGRDEWTVIDTVFPGAVSGQWKYTWMPIQHRIGTDGNKYPLLSYTYSLQIRGITGQPLLAACTLETDAFPSSWDGTCGGSVSQMECLVDSLVRLFNALSLTGDSLVATKSGQAITVSDSIDANNDSLSIASDGPESVTYDTVSGAYHEIVYVDTLDDVDSPVLFDYEKISKAMMQPGAFIDDSVTVRYWTKVVDTTVVSGDTIIDTSAAFHAYADSAYYVAASYVDPATGLESPRGPAFRVTLVDSLSGDSASFRSVTFGIPAEGRPSQMRLWQTVVESTIDPYGDSVIWFGLYDLRHKDTSQTIIWGNWTDVHVAIGVYPDSIVVADIYEWQIAIGPTGDALKYPDNQKWDNQIAFDDMEYAYDRFWGMKGNRLYYSGVNDPSDWNPLNFMRVDERVDDHGVALKNVGGRLYFLKQRSIWVVTGNDPRYDGHVALYLDGVGAVSYEACKKHRSDLYFLTPDAELWSLRTGELSWPVDDYMDSLFIVSLKVTLSKLESAARVVPFNDRILVVNDSTGECMAYRLDPKAWTAEEFNGFSPMGSFYVDTTPTIPGFGSSHIMWDSNGVALMREFEGDIRQDGLGSTEWAAEFYVTGAPGGYWQLMEVLALFDVENDRNWFRYKIRSESEDLAAGSLYVKEAGDDWKTLRRSLDPEQATQLYLQLYSPAYDSVHFLKTIDSVLTHEPTYNNFSFDNIIITSKYNGWPVLEGAGDDPNEISGGSPP